VKRIIQFAVVLVLAGCGARYGGEATGASSSEAAVRQFLFAAKAQDLQAMSAVWGTAESPTRDRADRTEMERRLIIMTCHLRHDESRIGPPVTGATGTVTHRVELTQGDKQAAPVFTTVRNTSSGRWYVQEFDILAVQSFCRTAPAGAPAGTSRPPIR
jgi:hypothetical protein